MNKLLNKITQGNMEVVAANANATVKRKTAKTFIKDFVLQCSIGIYEHERDVLQPLTISVEADCALESFGNVVTINDVVNYEHMVRHAEEVAATGHINLIEDFTDRLAAKCFSDPRIETLTITVQKTTQLKDAQASGFSATYERN